MTPPTRSGGVGWCLVFVGGVSGGVTPGPIPNPEAKSTSADGTALGRVWESRSPPAYIFFVGRGRLPPLCGVGGCGPLLFYPQVNDINQRKCFSAVSFCRHVYSHTALFVGVVLIA